MKKFVLMNLAALAVSGAWAITATKEYVDRSTNAVLVASKAETAAATNATLAASKAYTDAAIEGSGSVTPGAVTNIAGSVASNVVTKSFIEGLGIGIDTNGVRDIVREEVPDYLTVSNAAVSAANSTNDFLRKTGGVICTDDEYAYASKVQVKSVYGGGISIVAPSLGTAPGKISMSVNGGGGLSPVIELEDGENDRAEITIGTTKVRSSIDGLSLSNQVTRSIVETWEGFLGGSNVVFSITNYISGSYNLNSAKLKILEMTNGVYREVYNSRDEILIHLDEFRTNEFAVATNAIVSGVDAKIADKADRAWGKYTSAGGVAPSNTVYMTAPSTVFAGGLEYERVAVGEGMVGILTTKGAPTYTTGDEGTFKFQDDGGTNFFGFAKTDSYVIGCNTDGISVQNHIVTLTYNVTMSGVPCIWYCPTLDVQPLVWEQLNTPDGQPIAGASHTVTWEESPVAGTEVCYLNCPEGKGFFKATIEVAGSAKFMTNMPADLGGGIVCTNTATGVNGVIRPTFNGSTVTWIWSGL